MNTSVGVLQDAWKVDVSRAVGKCTRGADSVNKAEAVHHHMPGAATVQGSLAPKDAIIVRPPSRFCNPAPCEPFRRVQTHWHDDAGANRISLVSRIWLDTRPVISAKAGIQLTIFGFRLAPERRSANTPAQGPITRMGRERMAATATECRAEPPLIE